MSYPAKCGCANPAVVMVEISMVYDGGLFYQCDNCRKTWHRWPEDSPLRSLADAHMSFRDLDFPLQETR